MPMYWLSIVFLTYMFITLYFFFLFILIYLRNRKDMFSFQRTTNKRKISVIIPAFNEEDCIEEIVKTVLASSYPIEKVFVVNDGSTDNTAKIVGRIARKNQKIVLLNKKNSGKADSLNYGLKHVETELVAVVDADSYLNKDAIVKLIGHFDNPRVGVATPAILVKNRNNFIENLQAIEYVIIAWTRKLLGYVDSIYVTPGPLAIYRTDVISKLGFDTKNMTEDIEATWHLAAEGWDRKMSLGSTVTTIVPSTLKGWYKQRVRWNIGGLQTINKYRNLFFKSGMVGFFILPFFTLTLILGFVGLSIFIYLFMRRVVITYIATKLSLQVGVPVITMEEFFITPTVLNFFGIILFLLGAFFTLLALTIMKERELRDRSIFKLLFYLLVYITIYPTIIPIAIYRLMTKNLKW